MTLTLTLIQPVSLHREPLINDGNVPKWHSKRQRQRCQVDIEIIRNAHTHTHTHSDHAMQRNADCGCHNALDLAPSPNALIEYVLKHVHRNFVLNFSPLHRVVRKTCAVDVLNAVLKLPLFRDGQITPPFVIELQITNYKFRFNSLQVCSMVFLWQ